MAEGGATSHIFSFRAVELQLGPSDRRCTLSCIWESKSSVDQACKTENDDYKLGANADSRYKKGIAERSTALEASLCRICIYGWSYYSTLPISSSPSQQLHNTGSTATDLVQVPLPYIGYHVLYTQ